MRRLCVLVLIAMSVASVDAQRARARRIRAHPSASALPAGVTLQDIDGGATFFSSLTNSGPLLDNSVFPIAVFQQYDLNAVQPNSMTRINGQLDAGINIWVHLANGSEGATVGGTDIDAILNHTGSYVIADPTQTHVTGGTYLSTYGSRVIGWAYQDETEGSDCNTAGGTNGWLTTYSWLLNGASCAMGINGKKDTQFIKDTGQYLMGQSPTRIVYQGYTNGYAFDWFVGGPVLKLADAGHVIGYDVYVLVDTRSTFGGKVASIGHVWAAYESVQSARLNANYTKPIWPDLEMTGTDWGFNTTHYQPTDAEITALPWSYIIGGARGILWFPFCFCGTGTDTHDAINDTTQYPTIHGVIKAVDAKIQSVGYVINSKFALGYVSSASAVNYMAKYVPSENAVYVFAAIKQAAGITATFTITGSPTKTIDVMFESRTISMTAGSFSDSFTGETGWHVYKIPL